MAPHDQHRRAADQRKRFGPLVLDPTVTLADLAAVLLFAGALLMTYTDLRSDLRSQREADARTAERVQKLEAQRDEMTAKLDAISSKLDQLLGREAARAERAGR